MRLVSFANLAAAAALTAATGCLSLGAVETGQINAGSVGGGGFVDERGTVQMVSTLIGGKNVFIPSTVVVTAGTGRTLTIYNTTDTPHGFRIPSLGVEAVLTNGEETVVTLPPLVGGRIYNMMCHLHPPHRHATLMVVPSN
jgi:hypothetical protein